MYESYSMNSTIYSYLASWAKSNDLIVYSTYIKPFCRVSIYTKNKKRRLIFDIDETQPKENWLNIASYISRVTSSRFFGGSRAFEKFDGVYDRVAEQERKLNYVLKRLDIFSKFYGVQYYCLNDWPNNDEIIITFTKGTKTRDYTIRLINMVDVTESMNILLNHCANALDLHVGIDPQTRELMRLSSNSIYGLDMAKRESETTTFTVMPRQCGKTATTAFSSFIKEMIAGEHDGKRPIVWNRDARNSFLSREIREMLNKYSKKENSMKVYIKEVIFNDPATIVFWSDNTKTVVKAQDEKYDPEKGLAMAITKKFFGNEGNYYDQIKKWLPKEEPVAKDQVVVFTEEKKEKVTPASLYRSMKVSEAAKALKVSESTIRRKMKNKEYLYSVVNGVTIVKIPKWELDR